MAQQQAMPGQDIEPHIIEEFVAEYNESHTDIETLLLKLEDNTDDLNLLNELFRKVHNIKGNAQLIGLDLIAGFVHALENLLDRLRKHDLIFDKLLGEMILRVMDHIGTLCNDIRNQQPVNTQLTLSVQHEIHQLATANQYQTYELYQRINQLFDGNTIMPLINKTARLRTSTNVNLISQQLEDLKFFAQIIESAEQRSPYWNGRSQRILNIVLEMNNEAGQKVDSAQLEAAVYLHDFGMAFLPLEILHKGNSLTEDEYRSMQLHTRMGAALLGDNPYWHQASDIIIQHHEREDGQGYPNRLSGEHICDGAKILAIADAFEAMTNQRANRADRIPFSQALKEINHNAGSQFSPFWVDVFISVIRKKTRRS